MSFYVYILASRKNGTLYVGMTDDLARRIWMHREGVLPGFTKDYAVKTLVWFEQHETRESALARERAMKKNGIVHGRLSSFKNESDVARLV